MSDLWQALIDHGATLLLGVTVLLGLGSLAVWRSDAPIHRQRLAELSVAAALVFLSLALVPMRRWSPSAEALLGWFDPAPVAAPEVLPVSADAAVPVIGMGSTPGPRSGSFEPLEAPVAAALTPSVAEVVDRSTPSTTSRLRSSSPPPSVAVGMASGEAVETVSLSSVLVTLYLVGAGLGALYVLLGLGVLTRVLWRSRAPTARLQRLVEELASDLPQTPRVRVTHRPCRPFVVGVFRPTIVLPEALCGADVVESLRHVLLHEFAHFRQRDGRGHALFALALPVLYAHPLYWWLRSRAHLAAEVVADEIAASHSSRATYARALIRFSERRDGPVLLGTASILRSPSEFYRRMNMLLKREERLSIQCSRRRRGAQGLVATLLVAGSALAWGVPLPAQDPGSPRESELRQERDRLRRDVRVLRRELSELRKLLEARAETTAEEPTGAMGELLRRRAESTSNPFFAAAEQTEAEPDAGAMEGLFGSLVAQEEAEPDDGPFATSRPTSRPTGFTAEDPRDLFARAADEANPLARVVAENESKPFGLFGAAKRDDGVPSLQSGFSALIDEGRGEGGETRARSESMADRAYVYQLMNQVMDLFGEIQVSKFRIERLRTQAKAGLVGDDELKIAEIRYDVLQRRYQAVCSMVTVEEGATRSEIKALKRGLQKVKGDARDEVEARVRRLETRLGLLRSAH